MYTFSYNIAPYLKALRFAFWSCFIWLNCLENTRLDKSCVVFKPNFKLYLVLICTKNIIRVKWRAQINARSRSSMSLELLKVMQSVIWKVDNDNLRVSMFIGVPRTLINSNHYMISQFMVSDYYFCATVKNY